MSALETTGGNRLPVLAGEIRKAHASARDYQRRTLEQAVSAGELLLEAKALVGHGQWLPWLRDHCEMSERKAQLYMRLAKNKAELENRNVADLGIRGAIAKITEMRARPWLGEIPTGFAAIGRDENAGRMHVVAPSYQLAGHFYITTMRPHGEHGSVAEGSTRPVRSDWLPYMLADLALREPPAETSIEWRYEACSAWTYNVLLFDSAAAYVDSIDDKEVLADIALNRPPKWPTLPDELRTPRMVELFEMWKSAQRSAIAGTDTPMPAAVA